MVINWLDFIRYELTLKSISKQKLSRQHLLVELSLARLFNSHWHNSPTFTGTIVQQSLAQLFKSHWHDWSTVTGTSDQQSLVWFFNSGWHDCSTVISTIIQQSLWHDCPTVTGTIDQQSLPWFFISGWHYCSTVTGTIAQQLPARFYFLCWQNSSTVKITVEELCHVPGIRHMIPISYIISEAHSEHCQASQMVLFAKIVSGCKALIISIESSIFDVSISKTVH